ncbi:MAG TPA: hypothetical protein P5320_03570 [Bacteroidales bacterium]|nr:hypothetical protein [Bacteroidales bacterium]HOK74386.1 hypothetical protein [Bacteroidales bacterium]HOM41197.1 hypothetical protein [Bacteroidales bacterium]HOU29632.1 hypothetical protein [Bacteroidales bacterium]HPP92974.1 hypothetical protein [Bacteroidales bacterium]
MNLNSTPFVKYDEIDVEDADLIDEAWDFRAEFHDVFELLDTLKAEPDRQVTERLMEIIEGQM